MGPKGFTKEVSNVIPSIDNLNVCIKSKKYFFVLFDILSLGSGSVVSHIFLMNPDLGS